MFLPDWQPICRNLPREMEYANLYFIHDLHFGSPLFDNKKWERFKKMVRADDHGFVLWIGDLMENAIPGSKSDPMLQTLNPHQQKEMVIEQFIDFGDQTISVVPGNHEHNRTTKVCGLYPIYDACERAGIGDKYRDIVSFVNIGIGESKKDHRKQVHYFGQTQHQAKALKSYGTSDFTDGIDFFAYGHDHTPGDNPSAKMVFDQHNNVIRKKNIENIDCGSGCSFWGSYSARGAGRPKSDKVWTLTIFSEEKRLDTHGFYP